MISPAPTANGDLHLGHIAGPFLAADVYTRYARAAGREVLFGTGVQDTPTYVVTTAARLGTTPRELADRSAKEIQSTLASLGIAVDAFTRDEERFTSFVTRIVGDLWKAGALRLESVKLPFSPRTRQYLVDGHVRGGCPVCLADGCAGLCESCGHPIAAGDLVDPRSTLSSDDPLELRDAWVLVLPMEQYRARLREHFAGLGTVMRPHMAQAIEEMLSRPLPNFPVTYPVSWGISAPQGAVAAQVINPNAEPVAWAMYCSMLAAENRGIEVASEDALWRPEAASEVVYFLGFDNIFPFAISGLAMLLALSDRYVLPKKFLTNEFYELDYQKFSTSRGHAVWGRDLARSAPRDLIRFYLASTSPEHQRTNFDRDALDTVTRARLVEPWNVVAARVEAWVGHGPLSVSEHARAAAACIVERFTAAYELPRFSVSRVAETLTQQLDRLQRLTAYSPGDFCHEVDVVLRCAAPILIDLAAEALVEREIHAVADRTEITPRLLPRLRPAGG